MTRFVSIAEFWNVYDAATAAAALESAGILALNPDWHFFHLKPHILFGSTGARIWVLETDLERSAELLRAGHQQREPIHVCPDCDSEAYHSSALSVLAFLSSFFIAGAAGGAVFAALAQRSTRLHCPACDKAFHEKPPAPFTESELGYDPQGPALGEWLGNGYQKLISLRKL
jgi:hypothetical protein